MLWHVIWCSVPIIHEPFQSQHGGKSKKGKMSEQLKYCNNLMKELFSKKHQASLLILMIYMSAATKRNNEVTYLKFDFLCCVGLCLALLQTSWCWCTWSSWLPWYHQEAYGFGNNQSKLIFMFVGWERFVCNQMIMTKNLEISCIILFHCSRYRKRWKVVNTRQQLSSQRMWD